MKRPTEYYLKISSITLYLFSALFYIQGLNKAFRYANPEYYGDKINVYVGGDAYNYIINSNYATGYYVLCIGCLITGTLILCTYFILKKMEGSDFKQKLEICPEENP